jgi:hypothetical protein
VQRQEFLTIENMPLIDIHYQMKVVHGQKCADVSTVQCWAAGICDGKSEQLSLKLSNKQRSGRPQTAADGVMNCNSWGSLESS